MLCGNCWEDAAQDCCLLRWLVEGVVSVDIRSNCGVCGEEFRFSLGGEVFDLAGVSLGELEFLGVNEASQDECAGFANALTGIAGLYEAAVVAEIFRQIAAGPGEDLAEVFRGDFTEFGADLVADLEDFSKDVGETLTAVEAEQGSDEAIAACFLGEDFNGDGNGTRVGWIAVGYLAETGGRLGEGADGVRSRPGGFSNAEEMVDGNAIQPCTELCFSAESRESVDGFEEDLLCGVFCIGAAVQHAYGEIEDPGQVACDEEFELIAVSREGMSNELFVGRN